MDTDKIHNRIRNLLNLANDDSAADGEINNALKFARRLMLQHQIEESEFTGSKDPHEVAADTEYARKTMQSMGSTLSTWEGHLAWVMVRLVGTVQWYFGRAHRGRMTKHGTADFNQVTGRQKLVVPLFFYGPADDVSDATHLYAEWQETIMAMARLKVGGALRGPGRSYCEGFVNALLDKVGKLMRDDAKLLREGEHDALPSGDLELVLRKSMDLVKAKHARGKDWLLEEHGVRLGRGRKGGTGGAHHSDAYGAGRSDGLRANISRKRTRRLE